MAETEIVELEHRAASLRLRAAQTRWLAESIEDVLAQHQLLQCAEELERQAENFEIEAAVMKETSIEDARAA